MMNTNPTSRVDAVRPSRREFLKTSALAACATLAAPWTVARSAHAAGSDVIRVGLIGCGGRGSAPRPMRSTRGPTCG